MFGALMTGLQVVLAALPNIEMVSLLVILFTLVYGWKVLYIIYVFTALEFLLYGFNLWMICYLYVWTILAGVTQLFRGIRSSLAWAVISGLFGLLFGAFCEIPFVFVIGFRAAAAAWISGIPFDLLHCRGNFTLALTLFSPLHHMLSSLNSSRISA